MKVSSPVFLLSRCKVLSRRACTLSKSAESARLPSSRSFTRLHSLRSEHIPAFSRSTHAALIFASGLLAYAALQPRKAFADGPEPLKQIRLSEVHKHGPEAERVWVIKGEKVYDITDWIPNHPGGEVILRAAGSNIDQYWKIFAIHQKQEVYDILEQYVIGVVHPDDLIDGKVPADSVDDPFKTDPQRDTRLTILSDRPCNAETPAAELEAYLTPNDVFYVRNHLWTPAFKTLQDYKLTVELNDGEEVQYTLDDLRNNFKEHTITAVLQCSGNRRAHMNAASRQTQGLPWGIGAIGNAEWTGVKLRDVLKHAGLSIDNLPDDVKHAQFSGSEAYGASIPIEKAIDKRGDVLLAYKMNGEELPRDHGYPLRVIVPGHVAARSVKWVKRIAVAEDESQSQWQQRDYKCFGPNERASQIDWSQAPAIQETPVQSAFTHAREIPSDDRSMLEVYGLNQDAISLQGYAYSGGGRRIIRVDVSPDGGRSWRQAELVNDESKGAKAWAWCRWKLIIPKDEAGRWFTVKAIDEAYQTQPEDHASNWNFRGNLTTAWQRVRYERPE